MGLLDAVTNRMYREGDVVAILMAEGSNLKYYPFQIETVEYPNNRYYFSLGTAAVLAVAGTDWDNIQDSSNNYILEPQSEDILYQFWWGVAPSYIRVYRRYPVNVDRGSLVGTRAVGTDPEGYIDGYQSPHDHPSIITETHTIKGLRPSYIGYHPYAVPATPTVRMSFYVATYDIRKLRPSELDLEQSRIISIGGRQPVPAPNWVRDREGGGLDVPRRARDVGLASRGF